MISDKMFVLFGIMLVIPAIFTILISLQIVDATTATILTMLPGLVMLFYLRKSLRGLVSGMGLGGKMKFQCLRCQGTKFDPRGQCYRCGSKARKSI